MKKAKGMKGLILMLVFIALIVGYYFYLSNRSRQKEEQPEITAVQEVLLRNLENNYPPTPKEVLKYYSMITQCFYNEKLEDADVDALGLKARELYDSELAATQSEEKYLASLKFDIASFGEKNIKISNFATSSSTDVDYFSKDSSDWARLYCNYDLRQGTKMMTTQEVFLMRKDADGHWKIYGWMLVKPQESEGVESNE